LQAQGAGIEGEPGLGYVLRDGYLLPPLMFSKGELEALALGCRWVASRNDAVLALEARNVLAKVAAVIPESLRDGVSDAPMLVGPSSMIAQGRKLTEIRLAIRNEVKLRIGYTDLNEKSSERTVWPFALSFFDQVRIMVAWCELRQAYRSFRADRIVELASTDVRYPQRRQRMLQEWRAQQGIAAQD
jgi:predicted DNA-binding transcriptional regulator YafY